MVNSSHHATRECMLNGASFRVQAVNAGRREDTWRMHVCSTGTHKKNEGRHRRRSASRATARSRGKTLAHGQPVCWVLGGGKDVSARVSPVVLTHGCRPKATAAAGHITVVMASCPAADAAAAKADGRGERGSYPFGLALSAWVPGDFRPAVWHW